MTQDELLAALAPPRLPAGVLQPDWREALGLIGLGLLAALLVFLLLAPLLTRRPSHRARIRATRGLPVGERLLAIARILGHLPADLRAAAYGAGPAPTDERIEHIANRSGRRR
ncbi:hypothetical protein [Paracoccus marinaquae]|uniref:Uncharacterized protein n=1 Tax=Paracoccus marinaquae TaxID=2841926 RepID=A0ABS6AF38_9RHOB|nr:hypothetical protein [Paracoccus marinaquae]MBU3028722.1 hypothetical protein [Paracoccus marinaquae]